MSENSKEPEQSGQEKKQEAELEKEETKNKQIAEMGQVVMDKNPARHRVELLTIIGEVEGHESAPSQSKTTKYEHVLPKLAMIEDDEDIEGLLILLNTVGGDVEAGLAIAEMIASLSIPTVSLVLGGGHSIGVNKFFNLSICSCCSLIIANMAGIITKLFQVSGLPSGR